jgi:hypothetical protein
MLPTHYRSIVTMVTVGILALVVLAVPMQASDSSLPDAPSSSRRQMSQGQESRQTSAPMGNAGRHFYQGAPPAARIGVFAIDRRIADWNYVGLTGAMFGASVTDVELTERCQEQKTCRFVPPAVSGRLAMYGLGIPAGLAVAYTSYRLKRNHHWFWVVPEALITGANVLVAAHSWGQMR